MAKLDGIQKAGLAIMLASGVGLWGIARYALKKWATFETGFNAAMCRKSLAQLNAKMAVQIMKAYGVYSLEDLKKTDACEGEIGIVKLFFDWIEEKP